MANPFSFFNRENRNKQAVNKTLHEGQERRERIRQAKGSEIESKKKEKPSKTKPRSIVKAFNKEKSTEETKEPSPPPIREAEMNRKPGSVAKNYRREEFFDSISVINPIDRLALAVDKRQSTEEEIQKALQKKELSKIKVISFVGGPGTGKSTKAIQVSSLRNIDFFIDDGLLIEGGKIVAGSSAKRADTKIESVRQAIFLDDSRARNMRRTLLEKKPEKLMILGTSDSMIDKICERLWLSKPLEIIRIEDVSSPEERHQATTTRKTMGSHTIPVPSMEIKHEFSGYFQEPLSRLRRRRGRYNYNLDDTARTVVRPTFSALGNYAITDEALASLVRILLKDVDGLCDVLSIEVDKRVYGAVFLIELSLYYGYEAQAIMAQVQDIIADKVEHYTSINILAVHVRCRKVVEKERLLQYG